MVRFGGAIKRRLIPRAKALALKAEGKKHCSRCRRNKPFSAFASKPKVSGGYEAYCRRCRYLYERERMARHVGESDPTLEARWNALVEKRTDGCWGWKGRFDAYGYAQITHLAKNATAWRLGFTLATGYEFGRTEKLRSVCGHRWCVRPEHWDFPKKANAPKLTSKVGKSLRARRDRRLSSEVETALNANLPAEVRDEMRQELWVEALGGGKATRMQITPAKVKRALKSAWEKALGDPLRLSIDVPLNADAEDGDERTFGDIQPDQSIFSDPETLVAVARRYAGTGEGRDGVT